jgi:hypothetical protein
MKQYRCFLCKGEPVFKVSDTADAWKESHKHYMTYHFKEPEDAKKIGQTNR